MIPILPSAGLRISMFVCSSFEAHTTMPCDSNPPSLRAFRLAMTSTRPFMSSSLTCCCRPEPICLTPVPTSIFSHQSFSELGCFQASVKLPMRMSSLAKSSSVPGGRGSSSFLAAGFEASFFSAGCFCFCSWAGFSCFSFLSFLGCLSPCSFEGAFSSSAWLCFRWTGWEMLWELFKIHYLI